MGFSGLPGFNVNSQFDPWRKTLSEILAAMRRPRGTTAIWAEIAEIVRGSVLYQKNWLRNDKRIHERVPKTHMRNVKTGNEGSSVVGTVSATCRIGEFSSSSSSSSAEIGKQRSSVSSLCSHDEDDEAEDGFVWSFGFVTAQKCLLVLRLSILTIEIIRKNTRIENCNYVEEEFVLILPWLFTSFSSSSCSVFFSSSWRCESDKLSLF